MKRWLALVFAAISGAAAASPTGLNVIPTTDLVPLSSWIGGLSNMNTSLSGKSFLRQPIFTAQSQFGLTNWLEAGVDYAQTPDGNHEAAVFNAKVLLLTENDYIPNLAVGIWNVTQGQGPGYYLTISKTLNYEQEEEERYKAHHRRNRKLLGRRAHIGMMLDGHGTYEPFAGTDLQLNETTVFQADWIRGPGNGLAQAWPMSCRIRGRSSIRRCCSQTAATVWGFSSTSHISSICDRSRQPARPSKKMIPGSRGGFWPVAWVSFFDGVITGSPQGGDLACTQPQQELET